MQEEQELPKGWETTKLDIVMTPVRGIAFPKEVKAYAPAEGYVACLRTTNVQKTVEWGDLWFVPKEFAKREDQLIKQLDILISTANSYELVGKVAQVHEIPYPSTLGAFISLLRVKAPFDAKFYYHYLSSSTVQESIRAFASTTTNLSNVSTGKLATLDVIVPPLLEQRRIVAKLEELFSRLDAGVAAVRQSQQLLKRYRQSVLHAAVTGALTSAWRAAHPASPEKSGSALLARIRAERRAQWEAAQQAKNGGQLPLNGAWKNKYQEPSAVDTSELPELPELPEGWVWASVEQLGEVTGGLTKNAKRGAFALQIPYLRVANIQANKLLLNQIENIGVTEAEIPRTLLQKGDLLVVEGNGSPDQIGRVAIWDGSVSPCLHQNHLIKVRLQMPHQGSYVLHWLLSKEGRDHIRKVASSTSGLYTLSISKISALPVPLPPLAEQAKIVAEVERRLSTIDALELTLAAELKRAERLRQSLLHRAFTGRLVPQDATDEPAGELLARLRGLTPQPPLPKRGGATAAAAQVEGGSRRGRPRKVAVVEAVAEVVEAPLPAGTQTTLGF